MELKSLYGIASHAEGSDTVAAGWYSHAEGIRTYTNGNYSHVGGVDSTVGQNGTFAHGVGLTANGQDAIGLGKIATISDDCSFVWNAGHEPYKSHGWGSFSVNPPGGASGLYVGNKTLSQLIASGAQTEITGKMNVQDSGCTKASTSIAALGLSAYASGNQSVAIGSKISAIGGKTFAFGENIYINQSRSIAMGVNLSSLSSGGESTIMFGRNAITDKKRQFVWNGSPSTTFIPEGGDGTLNVNPVGGISGFYIGTESLDKIIDDRAGGDVSGKLDSCDSGCTLGDSAIAAWGTQTSATGENAIAFGDKDLATGSQAFSGGLSNEVSGTASFAYGQKNKIQKGKAMFAVGSRNELSAPNGNAFAIGSDNKGLGKDLVFMMGAYLSSQNQSTNVFGVRAASTKDRQFIWNPGDSSTTTQYYKYQPPANVGSFNINPHGGLSGFYIGRDNFIQCVVSALQMIAAQESQSPMIVQTCAAINDILMKGSN